MNWADYAFELPISALSLLLASLAPRLLAREGDVSGRRDARELAVLCCGLALGVALVYGAMLMGGRLFVYGAGDAGTDTIDQYVPFYLNLIGRVREGSALSFNFDYGLGTGVTSFQSWLFDPFNLVLVPLGLALGEGRLALVLVVVQALRIVCAGLLFDHLLVGFCDSRLARVLSSLLYAFSGYLVLWGQHYWLGTAFVVFTALVLVLELLMQRRTSVRLLLVSAVVAVAVGWSAYTAFMSLVAAALYVLLRLPFHVKSPGVAAYLKGLAWVAAAVACGLLLSGVLFLPYALFLLDETGRVTGGSPLPARLAAALAPVPANWLPYVLSRFLGSGLVNTGAVGFTPDVVDLARTNFQRGFAYEFPALGYSAGCLMLLGQFFSWLHDEGSRRERVLCTLSAVLVALYLFDQLLPTLLNAMAYVNYRSSFVLALPVCLAMSVAVERRVLAGRTSRPLLLASLALTALVVAWSLAHTLNGRLVCLLFAAASACVAGSLWAVGRSGWDGAGRLAQTALVAALLASSVGDAFFVTNLRGTLEPDAMPSLGAKDKDTLDALDKLREEDPGVWRVDKLYVDWTHYNDSLAQSYPSATTYNSTIDSDLREFLDRLWPEAYGQGSIMEYAYRHAPDADRVPALLNLRYVLSKEPMRSSWASLRERIGSVYVYENAQASSLGSLRQAVVSEGEANALPDAGERRALLERAVIVPDEVASTEQAGRLPGADEGDGAADFGDFTRATDGSLEASASAKTDAVACVAVPHADGWKVLVDGSEVESFRANYGFVGFFLPAGEHHVQLGFTPAGLGVGCLMSLAGLASCLALCLVGRRKVAR